MPKPQVAKTRSTCLLGCWNNNESFLFFLYTFCFNLYIELHSAKLRLSSSWHCLWSHCLCFKLQNPPPQSPHPFPHLDTGQSGLLSVCAMLSLGTQPAQIGHIPSDTLTLILPSIRCCQWFTWTCATLWFQVKYHPCWWESTIRDAHVHCISYPCLRTHKPRCTPHHPPSLSHLLKF